MSRQPEPWFREHDGWWYIYRNRKPVKLAKGKNNKKGALDAFHKLMSSDETPSQLKVVKVLDLFLDYAKAETQSYDWYLDLLKPASESFGHLWCHQLKPLHLTRHMKDKGWSDTTKSKFIGAVKAAFNYCVREGHIDKNPIAHMPKPACAVRERVLDADERKLIYSSIKDAAFKEFVFALSESGARPSEVRRLTAEMVDLELGVWILTKHKTSKKTKKPRIIYLTPALLALTKSLVERHPDGTPLFRNRRGKPWTRNAVRLRFLRLREKLPQLAGVISYTFRHSFATDALEKGLPDATVAELMGHAGTAILHKHYSKLSKKIQHLRSAVTKVGGGEGPTGGGASTGNPAGTP